MSTQRRLISKAELARQVGLTRQAVTHACLRGPLKDACVGRRVDLAHPSAIDWLQERGVDSERIGLPTTEARTATPTQANETRGATPDGPPDITEILDWKVEEVAAQFGSIEGFTDWLDARKKIAEIRRLDVQNARTLGTLISRDLVRTHVFGYIEATNLRLLRDSPKTIAHRVYALARAGSTREEAERCVRDHLSSQLRFVKEQSVSMLGPR